MTAPIIISGTTGEFNERRFCQFWGETKMAGVLGLQCLAATDSSTGGLQLNALCPTEWHEQVWLAFRIVRDGGIPVATHAGVYNFGKPTFTAIPAVVADDTPLFDLEDHS